MRRLQPLRADANEMPGWLSIVRRQSKIHPNNACSGVARSRLIQRVSLDWDFWPARHPLKRALWRKLVAFIEQFPLETMPSSRETPYGAGILTMWCLRFGLLWPNEKANMSWFRTIKSLDDFLFPPPGILLNQSSIWRVQFLTVDNQSVFFLLSKHQNNTLNNTLVAWH